MARCLGHKDAEVLKSSQLQVLKEKMEENREKEGERQECSQDGGS